MAPLPISLHVGNGSVSEEVVHGFPGWGRAAIILLAIVHVLAFCYWLVLLWKSHGQTLMPRPPSRDALRPKSELSRFELKIPQRFVRIPAKQK